MQNYKRRSDYMRDVPDYFWEWTKIDEKTGNRVVKSNTPIEILEKLKKDEYEEYKRTGRRCIVNINID